VITDEELQELTNDICRLESSPSFEFGPKVDKFLEQYQLKSNGFQWFPIEDIIKSNQKIKLFKI
jgi:hypothetical protein